MAFIPRLTDSGMRGNKWWYSTGNIFYASGYGLPNCTCYAYGRYAEIRGDFAALPGGNATNWWDTVSQIFKKGQEPALGAIACWSSHSGNYGGHVSIVEEILDNGDIITSNSAWNSTYFYTQTVTKASGYNPWENLQNVRDYYFRGFIYNDGYEPGTDVDVKWSAKDTGSYVSWDASENFISSKEADGNIVSAWLVYQSLGWSMQAVSAVLGVQCYESGMNPWRWQSDDVIASTDTYNLVESRQHGYGLNQFTPFNTYQEGAKGYFDTYFPNFLDVAGRPIDGDSQCRYVNRGCLELGHYFKWSLGDYDTYPYMPFVEFRSTDITDFDNLVTQWLQNYSRGAGGAHTPSFRMRVNAAEYCYGLLLGYRPTPGIRKKDFPLWMYLHYGI